MKFSFPIITLASLLISTPLYAAEQATSPKVFELFTSQGCSSCPPADRIASGLADAPNVLVLSYHVDYWDYIGWKDPYSSKSATQRQRNYASARNSRRIYTPQAIIQGQHDIVGSNRRNIEKELATPNAEGWVDVKLVRNGDTLNYSLPNTDVSQADIWLITYDKVTENAVTRGENRGKTLSHRNNVTSIQSIKKWDGVEKTNATPLPANTDGLAVLVQMPNQGKILGAGWL